MRAARWRGCLVGWMGLLRAGAVKAEKCRWTKRSVENNARAEQLLGWTDEVSMVRRHRSGSREVALAECADGLQEGAW